MKIFERASTITSMAVPAISRGDGLKFNSSGAAKKLRYALAATTFALLAACGGGGGGGGSGPVTSTETFQVRTALTNYITNTATNTGTISGTYSSSPVTGTMVVTQGNLVEGIFEGQYAWSKASTATANIVVNGANVPSAVTSTMFFDSNYVPLGESGGADYEVVTGTVTIPTTARVGDTRNLYSVNRYSSSSKSLLRGTTQVSYVLEPDTATTAILKIIHVDKNTSNTTTSISTISFQITPSGGITRKQETLTETGTAITVTF
jgi:hypothetical protein